MISDDVRQQYVASIGIECHVQLKTKTKLFSAVNNDARAAAPNTLISHIDLGMPGALPVLNEKAVELAMRAAFALGIEPQHFSKFDRKHYFYPDLPKGYQITQYDQPIIVGGFVDIVVDGETKKVRITRAHLEEDAGKSMHPAGKDYSLVDLNRAGTPLLEIVSEPDIHSPAEAKAYARELYLLMRYADVSDADLYHGNMRFDVNVSVSKAADQLGTRSETKNLNSFRSVEKAVQFEINRQIELLERGERIVQETRGWDDAKQKTFSQRSKEEAHDYRYFPDPDLPPLELDAKIIERVKAEMPTMPAEWRGRLASLDLTNSQIETLLDAQVELSNENYLTLIENALNEPKLAKRIANWLLNVDIPFIRENGKGSTAAREHLYRGVDELINQGRLSSTKAKELIVEQLKNNTLFVNVSDVIKVTQNTYLQVSDENEIAKIVKQVIDTNPKAAEDVKKGEQKAIGFLVGQVMKLSQGKANPALAQELIKKQLNT